MCIVRCIDPSLSRVQSFTIKGLQGKVRLRNPSRNPVFLVCYYRICCCCCVVCKHHCHGQNNERRHPVVLCSHFYYSKFCRDRLHHVLQPSKNILSETAGKKIIETSKYTPPFSSGKHHAQA